MKILITLSAAPKYKKGDFVICNFGTVKIPEYWCGKVTSIRAGKVRVAFGDSTTESFEQNRSKLGLVGLSMKKTLNKREIPSAKINDWLAVDLGKATPPRKKGTPKAKPTTGGSSLSRIDRKKLESAIPEDSWDWTPGLRLILEFRPFNDPAKFIYRLGTLVNVQGEDGSYGFYIEKMKVKLDNGKMFNTDGKKLVGIAGTKLSKADIKPQNVMKWASFHELENAKSELPPKGFIGFIGTNTWESNPRAYPSGTEQFTNKGWGDEVKGIPIPLSKSTARDRENITVFPTPLIVSKSTLEARKKLAPAYRAMGKNFGSDGEAYFSETLEIAVINLAKMNKEEIMYMNTVAKLMK